MGNSRSKSAKSKSGSAASNSSKGVEASAKSSGEEVKAQAESKPAEPHQTPADVSVQDTTTPASQDNRPPESGQEETPVSDGVVTDVHVVEEEVVVAAAGSSPEENSTPVQPDPAEEAESSDPLPPSDGDGGDTAALLPPSQDDGDSDSPLPPSDGDGDAPIQPDHADRVSSEVDSAPPPDPADGDEEAPQVEDSIPAAAVIQDTNGTEPEPQTLSEDASQYVPRLCNLVKWPDFDGYGFNLHAEKDKPGQYIGVVDPDSPADLGGMKEGDRIIEVNGENIETSNHTVVIQKIKSKGDKTSMLVVDKATDDYFKGRGQTICSSMTSVAVISTPPRLAAVDTVVEQQDAVQVAAAHVWDSSASAEEETSGSVDLDSAAAEEEAFPAPPQPLTQEWQVEEEEEDTCLPEPNLSLSDSEETGDRVTAVVAEQVESAPVPEELQTVQNGTEEVAVGMAEVSVAEEVAAPEENVGGGGGVVDYNPYEEVEVTTTTTTTTVVSSSQEDLGTATNGIVGGSVVESQPEAEPAVIHSNTTTTTTTVSSAGGGDLNLNLSAAEMKERLKSRKKQDPRHSKTSFETKYKMFEKM